MPDAPMLIDTHCHLNLHQYDDDREAVIRRAFDNDVRSIIIPAIDLQTIKEALALAEGFESIYAATGIHPNSSIDFAEETLTQMKTFTKHEKIVAIGEIGLDYYWDYSPKQQQIPAFEAQLAFATELELPVIIHNREASEDVIAILEAWARDLPPSLQDRAGVLHSFSAPLDIAERALASGFYIGFTGPITFKKANELREVASRIPLNRLLIETDGPYLTPTPYRGKRNEPAYVRYVNAALANLHNCSFEEMAQMTTDNAIRLFNLPPAPPH